MLWAGIWSLCSQCFLTQQSQHKNEAMDHSVAQHAGKQAGRRGQSHGKDGAGFGIAGAEDGGVGDLLGVLGSPPRKASNLVKCDLCDFTSHKNKNHSMQ